MACRQEKYQLSDSRQQNGERRMETRCSDEDPPKRWKHDQASDSIIQKLPNRKGEPVDQYSCAKYILIQRAVHRLIVLVAADEDSQKETVQ